MDYYRRELSQSPRGNQVYWFSLCLMDKSTFPLIKYAHEEIESGGKKISPRTVERSQGVKSTTHPTKGRCRSKRIRYGLIQEKMEIPNCNKQQQIDQDSSTESNVLV